MNPTLSADLVRDAREEGINLELTIAGTIRIVGCRAAVERWAPVIREMKQEIVVILKRESIQPKEDKADPNVPSGIDAPSLEGIRSWLARIGETDRVVDAIVAKCIDDTEALGYFEALANATSPEDDADDNRRTCSQCRNLTTRGFCRAARRGEISASLNYTPDRKRLHRCEGYEPAAGDQDRRHGRDRWPGLTLMLKKQKGYE